MYILGVNLSHHSSVCLLKDEKIIFYLENDRLSHIKRHEFEYADCLEILTFIRKYTTHIDHIIFSSYGKIYPYIDRNPYSDTGEEVVIDYFKEQLNNYKIKYDSIHYYNEHHLYHATNGFYNSKFDEAVVLIMDGGGMYYRDFTDLREIETMYYFSNLEFETVKKHYSSREIFHKDKPIKYDEKTIFSSSLSCGWIFNTIERLSNIEVGNVMCLSSYGDLEKVSSRDWFLYDESTDLWYTDNFSILETYRENCIYYKINPNGVGKRLFFYDDGIDFPYQTIANVAKKAQKETKEHTIRLIRQLLEKYNTKNVVLSGGYMLNCVNNYEYLKAFPDINFYIDPIAHDGGTSIGAAKYLWHNVLKNSKRGELETLYLG